ncbi:uncharacterized protein LOC144623818 [Crassostrea virginica]
MYAAVLLVCLSWVALLCFSVKAYENLALHQPAWQSSTWPPYLLTASLTADLAVEGRYTDLSRFSEQCARSNLERTAEWWVDLGGVKIIHHVFIQYNTDMGVWGIVSYKLIHSN